jgi:hypothetical protein
MHALRCLSDVAYTARQGTSLQLKHEKRRKLMRSQRSPHQLRAYCCVYSKMDPSCNDRPRIA